jgi:hypothetical protein
MSRWARKKARTAGGGLAKGASNAGVATASTTVDFVYELHPPREQA